MVKIKILGPNDPALDATQKAIDELPDINAELKIIPWAEYRDVLMESLQADESPHQVVFVPGHVWIPEFAACGFIENLGPLLSSLPEEVLANYDQGDIIETITDESQYLGNQYMIPTFTDGHILFYRSDLITLAEETAVPPTILPQTLLELVSQFSANHDLSALALKAHPSEIFFDWLPHFLDAGGELLDEDNQPAFTSQAGIQSLENYCRLGHFCPPGTHQFGNEEISQIMKEGQAALITTWGGQAGPILLDENNQYKDIYKAALFPQPCGGTWGMVIPTNQTEELKVAALEIALQLNGPQQDIDIIEKAGSPIRHSSYTKEACSTYSWLKAQREMLNRMYLLPKDPNISVLLGALTEAIYQSFLGKADPSEALFEAKIKVLESGQKLGGS